MRGELAVAEASVMLQEAEGCHVLSRRICPWIMGPCSGGLHSLLGRVVGG